MTRGLKMKLLFTCSDKDYDEKFDGTITGAQNLYTYNALEQFGAKKTK